MSSQSLKRYVWLSIAAAVLTISLKSLAWWLTGSVGLLSDALESVVNLAGALMALAMISVAEQPADEQHPYGHGKAEYFSSAFEGSLILIAAVGIAVAAIDRLRAPQALQQLDIGLMVSAFASVINFLVARVLLKAGKANRSLTLEADARHLMTDVWTSIGVLLGILAVGVTGWLWLDPLLALLVSLNIIWTGWHLLSRSKDGLMDRTLSQEDQDTVTRLFDEKRKMGIDFHALRMRESGARRFVEFHMLVPGQWTVQQGHDLAEKLEGQIREALPGTVVMTHLEPLGDPASEEDITLDRI